MEIKILQVFYDKNGLPYKDKERQVHFPIVGNAFQGASNTTKIRFYYNELDMDNETTFVAVSKLPNGKIGSKILNNFLDEELNENYALLELDSFYTQVNGDLFISLQGYQGGVRVEQDEQGIYQIYGTPTIQATGSIKLSINYATQFVGSGEEENVTLQRIFAYLGTKLGIRATTELVSELPTVGQNDVFYAIYNDTQDTNKLNIYVWNETTQEYVWVGDNTLDLGDYYTKEQGEQFEQEIDTRVSSVENELSSVASGSPAGVYATLSDLQTAHPTGDNKIYVVSADGHWYYWNGSAWTDGGVYQATQLAPRQSTEISKIKNLEKSLDYFASDFLTGKYYSYTGSFVDAASSIYLNEIDISNFCGGVIKVVLKNQFSSGSSRCICFKNHLGNVIKYYTEGNMTDDTFINENGDYEIDIPIMYDFKYMLFSVSSYANIVSLSATKNDVIKKDIIDIVNDRMIQIELNFIESGTTRLYSFPVLKSVLKAKKIMVDNIPQNIGVSLFFRETEEEDVNAQNTGWNYVETYTEDVSNMFDFSIYFRKYDNSSFTSEEISELYSSIKVYSLLEINNEQVYVDGVNGLDTNDGTQSFPFKTISKAILSGSKVIKIKPGEYNETISLTNKSNYTFTTYGLPTFDTSVPATPLIHLNGGSEKTLDNAIILNGCNNITFENIWCDNTSNAGAYMNNCNNITMNNCVFSNTFNDGLRLVNVNGTFNNCVAYNIGDESLVHADGFNIHGYGCTTFNNCVAYNCLDDGISHHDGCTGYINGGEFYNCGKGGVASPTHGSIINISGVYCHNNTYGLYADKESIARTGNILITNSVFINNVSRDIYLGYYTLNLYNCKYNSIQNNNGTVNVL